MTEHLPSRLKIELTLPIGMPVGGGFVAAGPSAGCMQSCTASHTRFAKLRSYRTGMTTAIFCFQPWIGCTGNFKSP